MGRGGKNARGQRTRGQADKTGGHMDNRREHSGKGRKRGADRTPLSMDARPKFQRTVFENIEAVKQQETDRVELKEREVVCPICGKRIDDVASAVSDRQSGLPSHFDCVLQGIVASESLNDGEQLAYIGQGNFAVVRFENSVDTKSFHIVRKIEWETHGVDIPWRQEISGLYSQVL